MSPAAALYVRASTEHQKYSTSNQAEALRRYAALNGLDIAAVYEDDGRSGLTLSGRPALMTLLKDVLDPARPFHTLLIYDVSRWGRFQDPDESAYYEFLCRRAGISVVYVAEPFTAGENGPMATMLKSIKRAMAAEYSRELSRKTYVGQRRIVLEGFTIGGIHNYGLRRMLVDGQGNPKKLLERGERKSIHTDRIVLTIGPDHEVEVVQRIYRMCADEGHGAKRIARLLNADCIPSPSGRLWTERTVSHILTNEKYAGTNVYGRTRGHLKQRRLRTKPSEWVRKEGAFQGIVSKAIFERVQRVRVQTNPIRTDEQLIDALAALYRREGKITRRLMIADPAVAAPETYACRFKGIRRAYALAGYQTTRGMPARGQMDREGLLQAMRELWRREGIITRKLMEQEPGFPGAHVYRWHFGGLSKAYALIGFDPSAPKPPPRHWPAPSRRLGLSGWERDLY